MYRALYTLCITLNITLGYIYSESDQAEYGCFHLSPLHAVRSSYPLPCQRRGFCTGLIPSHNCTAKTDIWLCINRPWNFHSNPKPGVEPQLPRKVMQWFTFVLDWVQNCALNEQTSKTSRFTVILLSF